MITSAIRFVTLAMFLASLVAAPPVISAFAAGGGGGGGDGGGGDPYGSTYTSTTPSSPDTKATRTTHKGKKKSDNQSSFDDPGIAQGYRAAYATIYDRHDYADAIEQLKALGQVDHPNVANLIGYSYRKLGDYKLSQVWYAHAESRSEPCADMAVLRSVAD